MLLKYHPDGHFDVRWQVVFPKIPKRKLGGPFTIHVFIDFPEADTAPWNPNWLRKINYAGSIFCFARDKDDKCSQCEKKNAIRGMVDLTDCMFKLGLSVHDEGAVMGAGDGNVPPGTITDPSSSPLSPKSALQIVVVKSNKKITLKDVGIDPDSIKVQCYQTITDEEKDEKKKVSKTSLIFPHTPMSQALAKNVVSNIVNNGVGPNLLPLKVKQVSSKTPLLSANLTGITTT